MQQFTTKRLTLRPLELEDANAIAALADDYDIARQTAILPHPLTLEDVVKWIEVKKAGVVFAILHESTFIGVISASIIDETEAELSYWIGRDWWGQGFVSEAAGFMVSHLFNDRGYIKLQASFDKENPQSGRVLQKAGFKRAGEIMYYSRARDVEVPCWTYTLTQEDWLIRAGTKDRQTVI